ncbi:Retrovirus-related Pol polyprotein from transposon opus [Nosema granulosis]|uniref:Retrovirus-related Pol polyprotein from transposon opus n=1 Tax=Nosema granulosis TaxID=83296 RepID=A0A9P6KYI3_9MICR|nr:Retrovirus-related Pol polyprotein from transposon opus [Nosema granulosis]
MKQHEKYCEWHETNTHNTRDCKFLQKLKEQYKKYENQQTQRRPRTPSKKVYVAEGDALPYISDEHEKDNKNHFAYTVRTPFIVNPFFINLAQGDRTYSCLLDTGADISIISDKNTSNHHRGSTKKSTGKIKSACGNYLIILEQIPNTELKTEYGETVKVNLHVVKGAPEYVILGKDFIIQYPEILRRCLGDERPHTRKNETTHKIYELNVKNRKEESIIEEYKYMFGTEITEMNVCKEGVHSIETTSNKPIYHRNERIPIHWEKEIDEEIKKNLRLGIIRKIRSSYCSRIVPAQKPDGSVRMCIDYRPLNQITIKDRYPLPRIDDIIDGLSNAKIFSTLDATSGYYQIKMAEEDKHKAAFAFKGGLYEFNRMPFGLCNAPATFQRAIDQILEDFRGKFVLPYLDDIIIYSEDHAKHEIHLRKVMTKLKEAGLTLNRTKSNFFKTQLKVLGSIISEGKVRPDEEKINSVKRLPQPTTLKELRSFLGVANFSGTYIPGYSKLIAPLCEYLKGETKNSQKKNYPYPKGVRGI